MHLVLVDAYDSFTYNLVQAFAVLGAQVTVVPCDQVDAVGLEKLAPDRLVFGPGPGRPEEAGCFVDAIRIWCGRVPLLGVCLGHQALAVAFGGRVVRHRPVHGWATAVHHHGRGLFAGVPAGAELGRYHSLGVDAEQLPSNLEIDAVADDGVIMGLRHREAPAFGVQFHPESVLSGAAGLRLLENFLTTPHGR